MEEAKIMVNNTNRFGLTAGEILGEKDFDILDDFIVDDEVEEYRDEILERMHLAIDVINSASYNMIIELYHLAAETVDASRNDKVQDFDLRVSEVRRHLDDALYSLQKNGFFE